MPVPLNDVTVVGRKSVALEDAFWGWGRTRDVPEPAHAVSELIGAVSNEGPFPSPRRPERNSLASERLYYETTHPPGALKAAATWETE